MIAPYYADDHVTLYLGDMREVLPGLGQFDACVTDPPYGVTELAWDRWPPGWPALVAAHTNSLWCFGSMRMFFEHRDEFGSHYLRDERGRFRKPGSLDWKLGQDVVWDKTVGAGLLNDRFRCCHEHALHFYRGSWASLGLTAPRVKSAGPNRGANKQGRQGNKEREWGRRTKQDGVWTDDGTRIALSVLRHSNLRGKAIHPTEKPAAVLAPLIQYVVPPGGTLLDPFAGSCAVALTARQLGRRTVCIEVNEVHCEKAAKRLAVPDLFGTTA
jgi:site-specific DNA-methyltransferase (adenine-specific)